MENIEKKKSGGGKLSRSETVTVRLDPQLRYLVELASRKQRRTLSSFIEWALEQSLNNINIYQGTGYHGDNDITIADAARYLWDVDESDRFAKLAFHYPDMLNHHEQIIWKLIRDNGYFWQVKKINNKWEWQTKEDYFCYERLHKYWDQINNVASGAANKVLLPELSDANKIDDPSFTPSSLNDDIPF